MCICVLTGGYDRLISVCNRYRSMAISRMVKVVVVALAVEVVMVLL